MAETPEEVAHSLIPTPSQRTAIEDLRCDQCDNTAGHLVSKSACPACAEVKALIAAWRKAERNPPSSASALRAQYVAGLERARLVTAAFDGPEAAAIGNRIRELAEQAKREGT